MQISKRLFLCLLIWSLWHVHFWHVHFVWSCWVLLCYVVLVVLIRTTLWTETLEGIIRKTFKVLNMHGRTRLHISGELLCLIIRFLTSTFYHCTWCQTIVCALLLTSTTCEMCLIAVEIYWLQSGLTASANCIWLV